MSVTPKTPEELAGMRVAGRLAAEVLEMIEPQIEVGMTTGEIDRICHDYSDDGAVDEADGNANNVSNNQHNGN